MALKKIREITAKVRAAIIDLGYSEKSIDKPAANKPRFVLAIPSITEAEETFANLGNYQATIAIGFDWPVAGGKQDLSAVDLAEAVEDIAKAVVSCISNETDETYIKFEDCNITRQTAVYAAGMIFTVVYQTE